MRIRVAMLWQTILCIILPSHDAFSTRSTINEGTSHHQTSQPYFPVETALSAAKGDTKNPDLDINDVKVLLDLEEKLLNGKSCVSTNGIEFNLTHAPLHKKDLIPNAPHLTFKKFLTMQTKRVVVSFRFSDQPFLNPFFLTFASKLKKKHSDIIIEKRILPVMVDSKAQPLFEVLVDGKIVMGGGSNSRERHILGGRVDLDTQSVFVSMEQISAAITKARKKRRPTTLYGQDEDSDSDESITRSRWQQYVLRNGMKQPVNGE